MIVFISFYSIPSPLFIFIQVIWDAAAGESFELIVTTAQAADMAAAILDHIRAIMSVEDAASS